MCSHHRTEIKDGKVICSSCDHVIADKPDVFRITKALDRLQDAARTADHAAKETVTVNTADLIVALEELDDSGVIDLDLD